MAYSKTSYRIQRVNFFTKIVFLLWIPLLNFSSFAQYPVTILGLDTVKLSICPPKCDTLKATIKPNKSAGTYKVDQTIPYKPDSFNAGTLVSLGSNQVGGPYPIGFNFCFFGDLYSEFYIAMNGWIGFSPNQTGTWKTRTLPDSTHDATGLQRAPWNTIICPWGQLDQSSMAPGSGIYYKVYGTAPYRRLVVSMYRIVGPYGFFGFCYDSIGNTHSSCYYTGQTVIYETTNIIDTYIEYKPHHTTQTGQLNSHGLHNKTGTVAVMVPGRNNTAWGDSVNTYPNVPPDMLKYDAVRFIPNGSSTYKLKWFEGDTASKNLIASDTTQWKICPTKSTQYIAQLISYACPYDTVRDTVWYNVSGGSFPITTSPTQPTCGQANGSIAISITDNSPNYIYEIKDSTKKTVSGPFTTSNTTYTANSLLAGKYDVTATDSKSCVATSSVTLITSKGPNPIITGAPTTFCQGGNVVLDAGSNYSTYSWSTGASTRTITVTSSQSDSVTVTDANGCKGTSPSVKITVNQNPNPTITASKTIFCMGDSAVLDGGTYSSYVWSTKDTLSKITVKTSGSFTDTVIDANGCKGISIPVKITVNPNPTPTITPLGPTTFCLGDSVVLDAGTYSSYVWSTKEITKRITIKAAGNFADTVTDVNGCKGISSPVTITISPNLNVTISGTTIICKGDSTVLTAIGAPRYVWNGNAKDTLNKITAIPFIDSTYIVVGTSTTGKCQGSDTVVVTVNPLPAANVGTDLKICAGESVILNSTGNQSFTYSWTPSTLNDTNAVSPKANPNTTTIYIAKVTDKITNCIGYDTVQVTVNPLPSVDAGSDVTITSEETATLKAITLSQGIFIWTPATGLNCTSCQSPDANPPLTTRYHVSLTDTNGCKASDSVVVYKTCGDLYIPNAFSPNGDSLNDFFSVYQMGYTKFQMLIFDKWGEKLYETDNFNKPWDGKVNGENAQQDVYVYIVHAWDCLSQEHKYIGHVTLLR